MELMQKESIAILEQEFCLIHGCIIVYPLSHHAFSGANSPEMSKRTNLKYDLTPDHEKCTFFLYTSESSWRLRLHVWLVNSPLSCQILGFIWLLSDHSGHLSVTLHFLPAFLVYLISVCKCRIFVP